MIKEKLKTIAMHIVPPAAIIGLALLGAVKLNHHFNDKQINRPGHHSVSYAEGLFGHVEYTRYPTGAQDVKVYPGWSHRYCSSKLEQDIDGDNKVDRIRVNGSEMKCNSLQKLLIREFDYQTNKEDFDKADKRLEELAAKYSKKPEMKDYF